MKLKQTDRIHITLTQAALAKVDRQEMISAKYGLGFIEQPEPKRIVREASPAPLRFSLASLLPAGV